MGLYGASRDNLAGGGAGGAAASVTSQALLRAPRTSPHPRQP